MNSTRLPQENDTLTAVRDDIPDRVERFDRGEQISHGMPVPPCSAYVDRIVYGSVHFYGSRLSDPLNDAAEYLIDMEQANGEPPFVLTIMHSYSREDGESQLAWQITLVVGLPRAP